ncbi:MFS transporter, PPP family, 3-phenylpropionic acid transporter [Methylobacterium sp. UNC378MF]|uniref:MFS transporter n=1 Tax=Methylobacterium sp. UNC378MF TaxID=1502748 RepID=UPI00088953C6|nr:MFS transporter [Methylobacterium sp. UNC378MF]SDA13618.1 MFS transporter, PPP family, 3-phenylpropionic acid transporter [Methylobacterium sp. UNC378MF]
MPRPSGPARLSLLYAVVFTEIGIAMPFMPMWLDALGLDAGVIGLLLALPIATRIAATAPLMALLDRGLGPRRLILLGSLALSLTYALMPAAAGIAWPWLAVLIVLNAVAGAPLVPCIDYLTLAAVRRDSRLAYSRIRMAGSVAFLMANLAGGVLLSALGGRLAVPLLLTGLALGAAVVAWRSRAVTALPAAAEGSGRPRLPLKLWLCIGAAAAIQASHGAIYGFGSIYWTSQGIPPAWIGSLWATGVLAEIALFAALPALPAAWRSPVRLLGAGAVAAILRACGMYLLGDHLAALVPLQCLHGLTFGATQLGAMAAVSANAPDGARGRAQGTLSAVNAGISVVATLGSGLAYRAGGPLAFLLMAPLAAAGLGLALASRRAPGVRLETDRQP